MQTGPLHDLGKSLTQWSGGCNWGGNSCGGKYILRLKERHTGERRGSVHPKSSLSEEDRPADLSDKEREQRQRKLWYLAIKPPMYSVCIIPVLVSITITAQILLSNRVLIHWPLDTLL